MKRFIMVLAAIMAVTMAGKAQTAAPLALEETGGASQVSTTVTSGEHTLRVVFIHSASSTPSDELLLILETAAGVNFRGGKGVVLYFDGQAAPISAVSQSPLKTQHGVTEVASYHLSAAELKRLSTTKLLMVRFEGPGDAQAIFRVLSANVLLKNYLELSAAKK